LREELRKELEGLITLIIIVTLVSSSIFLIVRKEWNDKQKLNNDIQQFVDSADSYDTDKYMSELVKKWDELELLMGHSHSKEEAITIEQAEGGRVILSVRKGDFGNEGSGHDLGIEGKHRAIEYMSGIIWLCGDKLKEIDTIRASLIGTDGVTTVEYKAELKPKLSLFNKKWKYDIDKDTLDSNSYGLSDLVAWNMNTTFDTASGKEWVRQLNRYK